MRSHDIFEECAIQYLRAEVTSCLNIYGMFESLLVATQSSMQSHVLSKRTIPSKQPNMDLNPVEKIGIQVLENNPKFKLQFPFLVWSGKIISVSA